MGKALEITDAAFEREVLHSTLPVLIDLWAPWCGPCKAIAPIVEELAIEYTGQLKVMKLDVDVNPRTPVAYGVQSIPTLLLRHPLAHILPSPAGPTTWRMGVCLRCLPSN